MGPGLLRDSAPIAAARLPHGRAPGRGRYDRALPREDRQSEQRERLLHATAAAFCEGGNLPRVSQVVTRAGVGRSTFYEFFDSTEHALNNARQVAIEKLENMFEENSSAAETPLEGLRRWMRAWCASVERRSVLLGVALSDEPHREAPALALIEARLRDYQASAVHSGSLGKPAGDDVLRLVAGGLVALARACFRDPVRGCDPKTLVEFVQRGLRR